MANWLKPRWMRKEHGIDPSSDASGLTPLTEYSIWYVLLLLSIHTLVVINSHVQIVLEIGAGVVVSSIRCAAESLGSSSHGLIRVNPSRDECKTFSGYFDRSKSYFPLVARSEQACTALVEGLRKESASTTTSVNVSASNTCASASSASDGGASAGVKTTVSADTDASASVGVSGVTVCADFSARVDDSDSDELYIGVSR